MTTERSALRLRKALDGLTFGEPVSYVYNPLDYAWAAHREYLRRYESGRKRASWKKDGAPGSMKAAAAKLRKLEHRWV